MSDVASTVKRFLTALSYHDVVALVDLLDDDVVLEFPMAPLGCPPSVVGREACRAFFEAMGQLTESDAPRASFADLRIYEVVDQAMAVAEYRLEATRADGKAHVVPTIAVLAVSDDKVTRFREYFDPRPTEETAAMLGAVLSGEQAADELRATPAFPS